jgi:hypothetical protein
VLVAVNVAEHVADAPVPDRVQGDPVNDPVTPVTVNATVPVGVDAVPTSVSVTVAVHVVGWLATTEDGLHTMVVDVVRLLTVTVVAALVLVA